jgi:hypothetical protein
MRQRAECSFMFILTLVTDSEGGIMFTINEWINDVSDAGWRWCAKRLAGNDTGLTKSKQVGPYLPKSFLFTVLPTLLKQKNENAEVIITSKVCSHNMPENEVRAVWYNNKLRGGTNDEARITRWKIAKEVSPLLDIENTGAICVFAFKQDSPDKDAEMLSVWVCTGIEEETVIENLMGIIEPGEYAYHNASSDRKHETDCILIPEQLPLGWRQTFPTGMEIITFAAELQPSVHELDPDKRLLRRRECEYNLFKIVEECHVLETIKKGFTVVDDFMYFANSISNRRKARAGNSLELQVKKIFMEEGLKSFSHDQKTEGHKRPDFIFPSIEDYRDNRFPVNKLRMLAAKTTCKDRWRQILNEAKRIDVIHLLTLQQGVSENQFKEMKDEGVKLVVPKHIHSSFPESVRPELITLSDFIKETKSL